MNIRKSGLSFFLLFLVFYSVEAQIASIKQLKESDKASLDLYFYPSTIRMLNIEKDPSFFEMVKDVKSLRVMTVDTSKLAKSEFRKIKSGILEEQYEELASMRSGNSDITLLALYNGDDMKALVALVAQESSYMFVVLDGSIDPQKAMNMAKNGPNLKILDEFIGNDEKEKKQRREAEEHYKKRQTEQDSLNANQ